MTHHARAVLPREGCLRGLPRTLHLLQGLSQCTLVGFCDVTRERLSLQVRKRRFKPRVFGLGIEVAALCIQDHPHIGQGTQHGCESRFGLLQGFLFAGQIQLVAFALGHIQGKVHRATIGQDLVFDQEPLFSELDFVRVFRVFQAQAPLQVGSLLAHGLGIHARFDQVLEGGGPMRVLWVEGAADVGAPAAVAQDHHVLGIADHDAGFERLNGLAQKQVRQSGLLFNVDLAGDVAAGPAIAHELPLTGEDGLATDADRDAATRRIALGDGLTERLSLGDGLLEMIPRLAGVVVARGVDVASHQAHFTGRIDARVLQQAGGNPFDLPSAVGFPEPIAACQAGGANARFHLTQALCAYLGLHQ